MNPAEESRTACKAPRQTVRSPPVCNTRRVGLAEKDSMHPLAVPLSLTSAGLWLGLWVWPGIPACEAPFVVLEVDAWFGDRGDVGYIECVCECDERASERAVGGRGACDGAQGCRARLGSGDERAAAVGQRFDGLRRSASSDGAAHSRTSESDVGVRRRDAHVVAEVPGHEPDARQCDCGVRRHAPQRGVVRDQCRPVVQQPRGGRDVDLGRHDVDAVAPGELTQRMPRDSAL